MSATLRYAFSFGSALWAMCATTRLGELLVRVAIRVSVRSVLVQCSHVPLARDSWWHRDSSDARWTPGADEHHRAELSRSSDCGRETEVARTSYIARKTFIYSMLIAFEIVETPWLNIEPLVQTYCHVWSGSIELLNRTLGYNVIIIILLVLLSYILLLH